MNIASLTIVALMATTLTSVGSGGPGWKQVANVDGVTVYQRNNEGTRVHEIKAEGFIEAPVSRIIEVLKDVEKYPEFMPYMIKTQRVGSAGPDAEYVYHLIDPPLVDERDYTLKITSKMDPTTGVYVREWHMTPEAGGPPPQKGVIRLELCDGSWELEPAGNNRTHVTYWVYTDPGGAVPAWIANKANSKSMPDVLNALGKRSVDPKWVKD